MEHQSCVNLQKIQVYLDTFKVLILLIKLDLD